MTDLNEIYAIKPPYKLRVVPVGISTIAEVIVAKNMTMLLHSVPPVDSLPTTLLDHSLLGIAKLPNGNHPGVVTVLAQDFHDLNHRRYEESNTCFESPQAMINSFSNKSCEHLSFYKDEVIDCSNMFILIKALANIIESGIYLAEIHINDKVFDVSGMRIKAGEGTMATPLVMPSGIVRNTVKLVNNYIGGNVHVIRKNMKAPHYLQDMILFNDFLLTSDCPITDEAIEHCPACESLLVEVDGEYNCTERDCSPFLEAFLNSVSRQTGIPINTLVDQYKREEKFHYSCDSTIEEQAREEVPVDPIRTYYDILGLKGLKGILERFFGLYDDQLYCSKAGAIDEMFYKHITFDNSEVKDNPKSVVYSPSFNSKPTVIILGTFDGLSEQTLELKLSSMGIGLTSVAQEADFCIAGDIKSSDQEFYNYVKEVSNILIIQTDGRIYNVFDLMKYF